MKEYGENRYWLPRWLDASVRHLQSGLSTTDIQRGTQWISGVYFKAGLVSCRGWVVDHRKEKWCDREVGQQDVQWPSSIGRCTQRRGQYYGLGDQCQSFSYLSCHGKEGKFADTLIRWNHMQIINFFLRKRYLGVLI